MLKEIGKQRYECPLVDSGFPGSSLSMKGFYVEFETETGNIKLYFTFPMSQPKHVMSVSGFWAVPDKGWEIFRKG